MKNTFFYLSSCDTCKRMIKELDINKSLLQDIKKNNISEEELEYVSKIAGSFEAVFSKRAMKYKQLGLAQKELNEEDYKRLILEEYTFLKRPVLVYNKNVAFGNSKKSLENMKTILCE